MTDNQKPLVLICDDEKGVRESLKIILSDEFEVLITESGPEALSILENSLPKVMLLDIKMPKVHGLEVLKQVKKLCPSLPVIIVTGYQSVEFAKEAVKLGAADYIPKPFESERVLKAVRSVVKR